MAGASVCGGEAVRLLARLVVTLPLLLVGCGSDQTTISFPKGTGGADAGLSPGGSGNGGASGVSGRASSGGDQSGGGSGAVSTMGGSSGTPDAASGGAT